MSERYCYQAQFARPISGYIKCVIHVYRYSLWLYYICVPSYEHNLYMDIHLLQTQDLTK